MQHIKSQFLHKIQIGALEDTSIERKLIEVDEAFNRETQFLINHNFSDTTIEARLKFCQRRSELEHQTDTKIDDLLTSSKIQSTNKCFS